MCWSLALAVAALDIPLLITAAAVVEVGCLKQPAFSSPQAVIPSRLALGALPDLVARSETVDSPVGSVLLQETTLPVEAVEVVTKVI